MSAFDDDIKRVLAEDEGPYDADREEGVFQQMARLLHGKLRWMAIVAMVESVVFVVLMILAAIEFFQETDARWQLFYATSIVLLAMLLLLVKLWGWMQMNRYALQREIKRLELRILELGRQRS